MNIKADLGGALAIAILIIAMAGVATAASSNPAVLRGAKTVYYRVVRKPTATVKLAVPFHRQERSLSCEIATLRMVLNFRGLGVTETELLSRLPFDPTPKQGNIWGDPDRGFVGDINGRMPSTGYGVHWGPINDLANQYRPSEIIVGWSPSQVAQEIVNGNPIIMWGVAGSRPRRIYWQTPEGETVRAALIEHTRVITGFRGTIEKPLGFYTLDPIYREIYYPVGRLYKNWEVLDVYGVVVR
jgi:uncharacterized protein YvpB